MFQNFNIHIFIIILPFSKNQERLEGDQWGRFLYRNFALFKFSQRRKEWVDVQAASTKKKQLIKDILEGKGEPFVKGI